MPNASNKMTLWLTCALTICARLRSAISDRGVALCARTAISGISAAFAIRLAPRALVAYGRSVPIWRERPFDPLI